MSFLIAVDDSLSNIRNALQKHGYQTVELSTADFRMWMHMWLLAATKILQKKNTIADERVITASDTDADMVINILRDNLKYYEKEIDSP